MEREIQLPMGVVSGWCAPEFEPLLEQIKLGSSMDPSDPRFNQLTAKMMMTQSDADGDGKANRVELAFLHGKSQFTFIVQGLIVDVGVQSATDGGVRLIKDHHAVGDFVAQLLDMRSVVAAYAKYF